MAQKSLAQINSILVVEPNLRFRHTLEVALSQQGLRVATADHGDDIMDRLEANTPDVVMLSCVVSTEGHDAFQLCSLLLEQKAVSAVIMTSNAPTKEIVLKALRAGAAEFLVNPAPTSAIYEKLLKISSQAEAAAPCEKFPIIDFGGKDLTNTQKVDIITREATTLRALPHAVTRVLRTTRNDESGAKDLTNAAKSDPAIAAVLLKRANSSFYGRGNEITDLQAAVVRLGFKECRDLMVGLSVFKLFSREDKSFGFNRMWYWLHSVACGILAEQIAAQTTFEYKEDGFTVGLLHDIGKIILDDFLNKPYQEVVRASHARRITIYEAENAKLGRNHTTVGSEVAKRWRFPLHIGEAILTHHERDKLFPNDAPTLAGCVFLANQMAKALLVGQGGDFIVLDTPLSVWRAYGFTEEIPTKFIQTFYDELSEYSSFLGLGSEQLSFALQRGTFSGGAIIVDPEEDRLSWIVRLFLVNQGFDVTDASDVSRLGESDLRLCVLRASDAAGACASLQHIESRPGGPIPTVCILPEPLPAEELDKRSEWLRPVLLPIDCFELFCRLRELAS